MIIIFLLGIFLASWLWKLYYRSHWDRDMSVQLHFAENPVYAGGRTHIVEQVENQKHLPLPIIEIAFHMEKELVFQGVENTSVSDFTYKRDIFSLLGYQRITRKLAADCTKRGHYSIQQIDCKAPSLLFEHSYLKQLPVQTDIYVYAKRTEVSGILAACEKIMGSMQCEKRLYEDPFAFASIREYTITDPLKTINWKASAKNGGLMVNTFESTLTTRVMIYLDILDSGIIKYEHLTEESISIAASLAQKMLNHGIEVGIAVNTCERTGTIGIEPRNGKTQLTTIERLLAERKKEEKPVAFSELLREPPNDALAILITKNATPENTDQIKAFLQETPGIWIFPFDKNTDCILNADKTMAVIKREVEYT